MTASDATLSGDTDARNRSTPWACAQSNSARTTSDATRWRRYGGSTR